MSPNQVLVRNMVGVVATIGIITTVALRLGHTKPLPAPSGDSIATTGARDPIAHGEHLYRSKGCVQCHSVDGSKLVGPSFKGDYGTTIALADGTTVTMDDAYIRESLMHPQAQARPGYQAVMPPFEGLLRDKEIDALTAYIRSLR